MGLAVGAKKTFPLKACLLDCADRGLIVDRCLGEHATKAKLPQAPERCKR
jgi:hypothetical protein